MDSALDLLHQVGKLEYRAEKLLDRDLLEIGGDCTADLGGDQDVHSAPAADQLEQLADVQLVGMHRDQAGAIELDLRRSAHRPSAGSGPASPAVVLALVRAMSIAGLARVPLAVNPARQRGLLRWAEGPPREPGRRRWQSSPPVAGTGGGGTS